MKVAVVRFPGANCDQDALHALRDDLGLQAEYVWHEATSLSGFDAVFLPGGFTYGDYLRVGAIAARAPIVEEVRRFANEGRPIIGACNGFQVLCESGILPGALLTNSGEKFICREVRLRAETRRSFWTAGVDRVLTVPIAHSGGRYLCDGDVLKRLQDDDCIAFRYVGEDGERSQEANPNGSLDDIAGILNRQGNVLGLMPHPERATREVLGTTDGRLILRALALVNA